ncbi:uncharacterized protein LOC132733447 [Ruditapes philippinarum]|uniref:uncharacterized protein LOC132733447 n=1 Tax=Ruditapes philippinarum TaxID=129788 RepID=UPI00295AF893|nr:uncharacterized protein LOC132733447 [Ruditapes philippinarum]
MTYIQYLLRSQIYKQRAMLKRGVDEHINPGAYIGLRRVKEERRTSFYWINDLRVTFSAWGSGQPATGDCTYMSFEIFNSEKIWSTVDCFDDLVDFFICEKPYSEDEIQAKTDIKENECTSVYRKEDFIVSPYSGKTCKNWGNLSGEAKVDFDTKFSSLSISLNDSTLCIDLLSNGIPWCYVNDPGKSLWEPCFLFLNGKLFIFDLIIIKRQRKTELILF